MQPFTISIPPERLAKITAKVASYDWDQLPDTGGWHSGVGKADLRRLMDYWLERFDWQKLERRLNAHAHFMTNVAGEHLHFIHVRGDGSKPPLLLLHGWPGSFLEFEALIAPLAADGHDVVVPSLPGFAFSSPIAGIIGPRRAGELLHGLMGQLFGGARYIVQGGDWGAHIASWMAHDRPDVLLGFHINMVEILAEDTEPTSPQDKALIERRNAILELESGYSHQQRTRPQTLGAALADSPVGAAAWILEKFGKWADLPKREDGSPDLWAKFDEETLLANILLYLAPPAIVTSTWIRGPLLRDASGRPLRRAGAARAHAGRSAEVYRLRRLSGLATSAFTYARRGDISIPKTWQPWARGAGAATRKRRAA